MPDTAAPVLPHLQVIVMSRKPEFFSYNMPLYEVVTPDGLMRPVLAAKRGGLYCGGSARQVSRSCVLVRLSQLKGRGVLCVSVRGLCISCG